jgi:hypothetical protein
MKHLVHRTNINLWLYTSSSLMFTIHKITKIHFNSNYSLIFIHFLRKQGIKWSLINYILRRAEGGAKIFGVFRVKNHDFTPKKSYFSNFRGGARNFWGISCEKSRFYAKKNHIFSNFRGGARRVRSGRMCTQLYYHIRFWYCNLYICSVLSVLFV